MIYIIFGDDDWSLREKLSEVKRSLGDEESLSLNTTVFDGRHLTLPELLNACNTPPFLGTHRLVIVEGLLSRSEQKTDKLASDSDEWTTLGEGGRNLPPSTVLVFIDGAVSKNNVLLKSLSPISEAMEFAPPKGDQLRDWITSRVGVSGGRISPQAVGLLAEMAGDNLWMLANEIEKLCLYCGERRIDAEDIRQITSYAREASVFPIIDAVVERRLSPAIRLMHQSLAEGMSPQYLLAMLTRQLRLMVQSLELGVQGVSLAQKRQLLGLSARYPIERLMRQSGRYSMPRLVKAYESVLETDIAIKTGRWGEEMALDLLVADLCG